MSKFLLPFFVKLTVLAGVLYVSFLIGADHLPPLLSFSGTPWLILFFYVVTAVFHVLIYRYSLKGNKVFIRSYMASTTFRLFLYISIMFLYAFLNRQHSTSFILTFFLLYFLFTGLEIYSILKSPESGAGNGKESG
ncbi:MAG: hypothetical protein LC117_10360 [Bacteroidia bacterium]|nr:hypothetical protein [Bacteroidia bacterium]MCZ2278318.1 hypothetical protein [Bacteroidia bacterium]